MISLLISTSPGIPLLPAHTITLFHSMLTLNFPLSHSLSNSVAKHLSCSTDPYNTAASSAKRSSLRTHSLWSRSKMLTFLLCVLSSTSPTTPSMYILNSSWAISNPCLRILVTLKQLLALSATPTYALLSNHRIFFVSQNLSFYSLYLQYLSHGISVPSAICPLLGPGMQENIPFFLFSHIFTQLSYNKLVSDQLLSFPEPHWSSPIPVSVDSITKFTRTLT